MTADIALTSMILQMKAKALFDWMTKLFLSYDLEKLEKLTHMTAWDQLWGSNKTLKYVFQVEYVHM